MIAHAAADRALDALSRKTQDIWYPPLVGCCAFLFTLSFGLPVELLVVACALMSPRRWIAIGLFAAIGSTLASAGLYLAFHHLGWNFLIGWYPDIASSKAWGDATRWLSRTRSAPPPPPVAGSSC